MDWITISLQARQSRIQNVEHVGPENARKKTEAWAAASQNNLKQTTVSALRTVRSCAKNIALEIGNPPPSAWRDVEVANGVAQREFASHRGISSEFLRLMPPICETP